MTDEQVIFDASKRLNLTPSMVRIFGCPVCHIRAFAGYLAPGSFVAVRCNKSNCPHHVVGCEWVVSTVVPGHAQPKCRLLRCQSDLCAYPFKSKFSDEPQRPSWNEGRPVCGRPWSRSFIAHGSRLLIWCRQNTCANSLSGFILCPS
jgi:hypothetical protein